MKETLAKLQEIYDLTTKGEWVFHETFQFNTHCSKKEIKGGVEKERIRIGLFTKSADAKFMAEVHKAWPEIMNSLTNPSDLPKQ